MNHVVGEYPRGWISVCDEAVTLIPIAIIISCNNPVVCNNRKSHSEPEFNYNQSWDNAIVGLHHNG